MVLGPKPSGGGAFSLPNIDGKPLALKLPVHNRATRVNDL